VILVHCVSIQAVALVFKGKGKHMLVVKSLLSLLSCAVEDEFLMCPDSTKLKVVIRRVHSFASLRDASLLADVISIHSLGS
jgi:hypothetical protein